MRFTPDGHEVTPGAVALGFPVPLPELRVEALYVALDPDQFRGRAVCFGAEVATTETTDSEPEAIRLAEGLVEQAMKRLFQD